MKTFARIHARAAQRKGGEEELMSLLPKVLEPNQLKKLNNATVLATMTRCVFQAGFAWDVIDNKWPGFRAAFYDFNPEALVLLSPDQIDALAQDTRIVRNRQKIITVPINAQWILDTSTQHGSFGAFLADWPCRDLVGLFQQLKKQGARLGGNTGQRVLRLLGKDTFILSKDVVAGLQEAGVETSDKPTSQRALQTIQHAFNQWHKEAELPYAHISKIVAYSIGDDYDPATIRQQMRRHDRT